MKSLDFQARIDAAREAGWRVVEDGDERVVLKRTRYGSRLGHLLVGAATVWWSFGLGNLAYAAYEYVQHSEYKVLTSDVADEDPIEVLRRRYARGEIDEDELERRAGLLVETEGVDLVEVDDDPDGRFGRIRERLR